MASVPRLSLPDGAHVELPEGEPVGAVLPPDAIAARVDGDAARSLVRPGRRRDRRAGRAASEDGAPHPPALHRARAGTGGVPICIPGAKYAIGPPIQDGFYYDFDLPDRDRRGRPAGDRGRDARRSWRTISRSSAKRSRGRRRSPASRTSRSSGRSSRRSVRPRARSATGDVVSAVPQRRVGRPLPRPARPVDRPARRVHADLDRRRLLARASRPTRCSPGSTGRRGRREEDLEAHLPPAGGSREARPPAPRSRARSVLEPRRARAGPVDLASARRHLPEAARGLGPRPPPRAWLRPDRHAAHRPLGAVGDERPPRRSTGRTCTRPWRRTPATTTSSR